MVCDGHEGGGRAMLQVKRANIKHKRRSSRRRYQHQMKLPRRRPGKFAGGGRDRKHITLLNSKKPTRQLPGYSQEAQVSTLKDVPNPWMLHALALESSQKAICNGRSLRRVDPSTFPHPDGVFSHDPTRSHLSALPQGLVRMRTGCFFRVAAATRRRAMDGEDAGAADRPSLGGQIGRAHV